MDRNNSTQIGTKKKYTSERQADAVIKFIEKSLPIVLNEIRLPSRGELRLEQIREQRKKKKDRKTTEEMRKKLQLIRKLKELESKGFSFLLELEDVEGASAIYQESLIVEKTDGGLIGKSPDSPVLFTHPPEINDAGIEYYGYQFHDSDETLFPPKSPVDNVIREMKKVLPSDGMLEVKKTVSDEFKNSVKIKLDLNAKESFERFLEMLEKVNVGEYGITPILEWTGEMNLERGELSDYMLKVMKKIKTKPKIKGKLNSTEIVRQMRG